MKNQIEKIEKIVAECSDPRDIINHYLRVKVLTTMTRLLGIIEQEYKERSLNQQKFKIQQNSSKIHQIEFDTQEEETELRLILQTVIESLYEYDGYVLTEVTQLLSLLEKWYKEKDSLVQPNNNYVCFHEKTNTSTTNFKALNSRKVRWADNEGFNLCLVKELPE